MNPPSDQLLVQRAAQGDVGAFEVLVRRYQLPIVRLCVGMLGDTHAGEDAAQDAFFAAWRSLGRFRQDAKFSTWLYRIAMNRCLRDLRRRKDPPGRVPEDLPTSRGVPETELETAESIRAVSVAVALLAAERRIPLLLREVEGLSYDQIAEVLGVSMTAVKSRIYRARLDLVRTLSHSGPDAP